MLARWRPTDEGTAQGPSSIAALPHNWFTAWRGLLSHLWRLPRRMIALVGYRPHPDVIMRFLIHPGRTISLEGAERSTHLSAFGVRAFLAGLILATAASELTGDTLAVALAPAFSGLTWGLARLYIMMAAVDRSRDTRRAILTSWAIGLTPFLIGVTTSLRLVAFMASAFYTWHAMGLTETLAAQRRKAVAWAFGGQALIVGTAWIIRAIAALLIFLGS